MNKVWITDSHNSAELFKINNREPDKTLRTIRMLDAAGMFETSWLIYNHSHNESRYEYGYSK